MNKDLNLTSPQNPLIKEVVKLRKRNERDSRKLFIIDGYRAVNLALKSAFTIKKLFYCQELLEKDKTNLIREAKNRGIQIFKVNKNVFSKIAYGDIPDGILALAEEKRLKLTDLNLSENPLVVVIESLEKPGNLGAILRTCDAAQVDALIVCDGKTDIFNPNCIRASLGAFFNLAVVEETSQNTLNWLRKNNFKIFLAMPEGEAQYTQADFSGASAIILGSEHKGLSKIWQAEKSFKIRIPMKGKIDSLNVAMSAAILVFEALRQRNLEK